MDTKLRIKEYLGNVFGEYVLGEDESIFSSGHVTSLFAMQLVLFIENEFGVKIENEDLDLANFSTINQFVAQKSVSAQQKG